MKLFPVEVNPPGRPLHHLAQHRRSLLPPRLPPPPNLLLILGARADFAALQFPYRHLYLDSCSHLRGFGHSLLDSAFAVAYYSVSIGGRSGLEEGLVHQGAVKDRLLQIDSGASRQRTQFPSSRAETGLPRREHELRIGV